MSSPGRWRACWSTAPVRFQPAPRAGPRPHAPPPALAMDARWHFVAAPYFWASGISGDVSIGDVVTVPIDASFSDILKDFEFGLQARFEGRTGPLGFTAAPR